MYTLQVRLVKVDDKGKVKGAVREYVGEHVTTDEGLGLRSLNALSEMVEGVLPDWGFALPEEEVTSE